MNNDIKQQKKTLRKRIRHLRASMPHDEKLEQSNLICRRLTQLPAWQSATHVGLYFATKNEVHTEAMIQAGWQQDKKVYLPVIEHETMHFHAYDKDIPLINNRFGIAEPDCRHSKTIDIDALDLIIMPLIAFDKACHRLGQGGGFYDRALANRKNIKPVLVGVGYTCQEVASVPVDTHDQGLDAVVTAHAVYNTQPD